jgi:hypothetical protein
MARDEVTRGTTRAVKTLQAVLATMKMPTTRAASLKVVSTASSCQIS